MVSGLRRRPTVNSPESGGAAEPQNRCGRDGAGAVLRVRDPNSARLIERGRCCGFGGLGVPPWKAPMTAASSTGCYTLSMSGSCRFA